jgi:tRNA-dihydrouridine synthase 3
MDFCNLEFYFLFSFAFASDVTLGEMAMCSNLLQGQASEWALIKRHPSEDLFGIQLCVSNARAAQDCSLLLDRETSFDFLDLNCGCPIDVVYSRGCGASLLERPKRIEDILNAFSKSTTREISVKLRIGKDEKHPTIHENVIPFLGKWGVSMATIHGRSRLQRYAKLSNWDYIGTCAEVAKKNGDIAIIGMGGKEKTKLNYLTCLLFTSLSFPSSSHDREWRYSVLRGLQPLSGGLGRLGR